MYVFFRLSSCGAKVKSVVSISRSFSLLSRAVYISPVLPSLLFDIWNPVFPVLNAPVHVPLYVPWPVRVHVIVPTVFSSMLAVGAAVPTCVSSAAYVFIAMGVRGIFLVL